jgi:hypothetical protein
MIEPTGLIDRHLILSCSAGNDSIAMIQLLHEKGATNVDVLYIDTGWAARWWVNRIADAKALCLKYGFRWNVRSGSHSFPSLILARRGFPMPGKTWCSYELKGKVSLLFEDDIDPDGDAIVCIGKRRDESEVRKDTPEFVHEHEHHDGRSVYHPLAFVTKSERDILVLRSGMGVLPHRSQECAPCVNANRADLVALTDDEIDMVDALEQMVGQNMFRPYHHMGAVGIRQVIRWAHSPRGKYEPEHISCEHGVCE